MSSKNNVNKDFYTMAGRDRPNEDLLVTRTPRDDERGRRGEPQPNFIPGAAPVGESSAQPSAGKTGVRSGSRKDTTARRDGKVPGQARKKAGASGAAAKRRTMPARRRAA